MVNGAPEAGINPFYAIMPKWFLLPGIILATAASIIASQAIISGSFTIVQGGCISQFLAKIKSPESNFCSGSGIPPVCKLVSVDFLQYGCYLLQSFG